eukprot:CAMPEP_0197823356 /NCGR_PEP_ID=MMETSP1437-20131217/695_1 /TAXON_ID=49252 ORGANISM="Eucampia antarctica, Strain CCMP1452" /NCGR_SAMPLE_ID=MMETSP1437 /ASSEMBLY_ACC=CAM_ASM_001096 /LENGTH=492 /DNA_ID=CAMNT_0043422483 /DNA_START=54 /DNA_END=1532 /DNA_ORIENTATION=-
MRFLAVCPQMLMTLMFSSIEKVTSEVVLSENVMHLSLEAAKLSNAAYAAKPSVTSFDGDAYDIKIFLDEPDQVLVTQKDGYCYVAFRGTTPSMDDWYQNIKLGTEEVCSVGGVKTCCNIRSGFHEAYFDTSYTTELEEIVEYCVSQCSSIDECLVLTGHSQGGAIAAVAGVRFAKYDPYVITFGEPPSVEPECEAVSSERWYRFVNTKETEYSDIGISYDPVPFAPGFGTVVFGHFIILGADKKHVAYVGLNSTDSFSPLNIAGAESHSMVGTEEYPGYLDRIQALISNATSFPIPAQGFSAPHFCTKDVECELNKCDKETADSYSQCVGKSCTKNEDCDTDRCDSGVCLPKSGSCMHCDEDTDCASNKCTLSKCTNMFGTMDDECSCEWSSDCASGRCEGLLEPICEAQLPMGAACNENSDCLSGNCNWFFSCTKGWFLTKGKNLGNKTDFAMYGVVMGVIALIFIAYYGVKAYKKRKSGYTAIDTTDIIV